MKLLTQQEKTELYRQELIELWNYFKIVYFFGDYCKKRRDHFIQCLKHLGVSTGVKTILNNCQVTDLLIKDFTYIQSPIEESFLKNSLLILIDFLSQLRESIKK